MRRIGIAAVAVGVGVLLAGCGETGTAPSPVPSAGAATSATTTTSRPKPTPVATVTAACPLLTSDDLKQILGSAALADLKAVEAQPKNENHGSTHTCTYGGESGFALSVLISTDGILTPAQTVKAMTPKDVASHDVPGVGEAATFYQNNGGIGIFSAAKGSHGQNRAVIFAGPAATPEAKFVEVGKLVTDQL